MKNNLFFIVGKKHYFGKINNYLIIDFINKQIGCKLFLKKIILINDKKIILINDNGLNIKILIIILKHFYIKTFSIKKKRRKNFVKKNINYKKKSLIFLQKII